MPESVKQSFENPKTRQPQTGELKNVRVVADENNPDRSRIYFGKGENDYFNVKGGADSIRGMAAILDKAAESPTLAARIQSYPVEKRPTLVYETDKPDFAGFFSSVNNEIHMNALSGTGYDAAGTFAHEFQHFVQDQTDSKEWLKPEARLSEQILSEHIGEATADTAKYQYMYELGREKVGAEYDELLENRSGFNAYCAAKDARLPESECVLAGVKGYLSDESMLDFYARRYHRSLYRQAAALNDVEKMDVNAMTRAERGSAAFQIAGLFPSGLDIDAVKSYKDLSFGLAADALPDDRIAAEVRSPDFNHIPASLYDIAGRAEKLTQKLMKEREIQSTLNNVNVQTLSGTVLPHGLYDDFKAGHLSWEQVQEIQGALQGKTAERQPQADKNVPWRDAVSDTSARRNAEWQGIASDLHNIPPEFDRAAAMEKSKSEYAEAERAFGVKAEHAVLNDVDADYMLAENDDAALGKLYAAENKKYHAKVDALYAAFKGKESALNDEIIRKTAQEKERQTALNGLEQAKNTAGILRDSVEAAAALYPPAMQDNVRAALRQGKKLPEPKTFKDKIKVLFNKRKINREKQVVDSFLKSVKDADLKEAAVNPDAFDKRIAAASQDLKQTGLDLKGLQERSNALRSKLNADCQEARENSARNFQWKAGNVLNARQLYQGENAVRAIKLPPMLGMQNLTEPVACAQAFTLDSPDKMQDLVNRMNKAGFKTVFCDGKDLDKAADPSVFVIRRSTHEQDSQSKYELLTPFFEPEDARGNIKNALRVVQSTNGADVVGAITPMTLGQMDQRVENKADKANELKRYMLKQTTYPSEEYNHYNSMTGEQIRDEIIAQALTEANKRGDTQRAVTERLSEANKDGAQYFFRGQAFVAGDEMSSYMNPTQRVGRAGYTYASPNPGYAMMYSGAGNSVTGGSGDMDKHAVTFADGTRENIGFVSVYKASSKTLMTKNFGLEDMKNVAMDSTNQNGLKKQATWSDDLEAHMNPTDNPLVARLLVSPRGVVTIPEDDPKWKIICDMYAPDTKDSFKGNEKSEAYGAVYEKRLNALRAQKKALGKVLTYGKTQEELDGLWNTKTKVNNEKAPAAKENADKNAMRADFATVLSGKPKEASQPKQAGMTMPPPMPTNGNVMPPPLNGVQMPLAPAGAMPPMPKQAESTMPPPPPPMPTKGKVVPPPLNGVQMPLAPAGAMPPPLNGEQLTAAPAGAMPPPPPPMPPKGKVVPPPINGVQMPLAPAGAVPPMPPPLNGEQLTAAAPAGAMPPPMPTNGKVVPPPINGVHMPFAPAGAVPPMPKQAESTMPPPPPPAQSLQGKLNQMSHKPNLMQTLQSKTVQKDAAPKMPVKQAVRQGESR